jgi:hypothetical protein
MRDMLIADKQALLQSLSATQAVIGEGWVGRIPTAGQMILGFILPFALAFVAIPLESFIHSARTVSGVLLVAGVRLLAFTLRVLGNIARHASRVLLHFYDLVIVVPLMVEHLVKSVRFRGAEGFRGAEEKTPSLDAPVAKSKSLLSGGRS